MARYLGVSRRRWFFWRQYLWEAPEFTRNCSPMSCKWSVRTCWLYREPTLEDRLEALERRLIEIEGARARLRKIQERIGQHAAEARSRRPKPIN